MRLNKYMSDAGYCSRRMADRLIEAGRITVNGQRAVIGMTVKEGDEVAADGASVRPKRAEDRIIYAFYKPEGIVSTMADEPEGLRRFLEEQGICRRVYPVGRLDKESCGLLLLTDDGGLTNKILKASNNHEKEYAVKVNKDITEEFIRKMADGVVITNGSTGRKVTTRKCSVKRTGRKTFTIVLKQGMNRQIRRMCGAFGYEVLALKRIRIMNISLKGLKEGEIRELAREEQRSLRELCEHEDIAEGGSYGED